MVYRFVIFSDEVDNFYREIKIDADATFFDFHNVILDSVNYEKNQITSFFLCSEQWEREQEVTLFDMDSSSEYDNLVMDKVELRDLITEERQRLMYMFDNVSDRAFFIELREIILGTHLEQPICSLSKGVPPIQLQTLDDLSASNTDVVDLDFYGDDDFDLDELGDDGFENIEFNDPSF